MTFAEWLGKQRKRNDLVGDIARDAAADPTFPRSDVKFTNARHFESVPTEVQRAFEKAWSEYAREEGVTQ